MIRIALYEKQTHLRACVVVRRFYGRCFGATVGSSASAASSDAIVLTDYWLNALFGSHPFHTGPSAASGASSASG
jgi:hypothetical protein